MRESNFDEINAALARAEFAVGHLRKRADELQRKAPLATTPAQIAALNLEAAKLLQQVAKITTAVHTGNPAPHLRLITGTD
jgi:hypothetical protein